MKIIIYLSLVYLSMVFCLHTADSENQRRDENLITSEHSHEDLHEYDAFERDARRKFEQRKATEAYKRIPAIRRIVPGEDEHDHTEHGRNHSEKRLHHEDEHDHTEHRRNDSEKRLHHEDDHDHTEHRRNDSEKRLHHEDDPDLDRSSLSDNECDDHVDYQPEDYPRLPIRPSLAPPVVVFGPQPGGRRQIHLPVYRRPSYSRLYDVAPLPVSYRTINPVPYSVPSRVRNVVLGYPPVPRQIRYVNSGFDDGIAPVEYRGYIAEEYDDFLKKK